MEEWSSGIVNQTNSQILGESKKPAKQKQNANKTIRQSKRTYLHFFYSREANESLDLNKSCKRQRILLIYTTRKLKTILQSLKSRFDQHLKTQVVYEKTCSGCSSIYVEQSCRLITMRMAGHQKRITVKQMFWHITSV